MSNKSLAKFLSENQSSDLRQLDLTQYKFYDKGDKTLRFKTSALMQAISGISNNSENFKLTDNQWGYLIVNSNWIEQDEIFGTEIDYLLRVGIKKTTILQPVDVLIRCFNEGHIKGDKIDYLITILSFREDMDQYFSKVWPLFSEEKKLFVYEYIHKDTHVYNHFIRKSPFITNYKTFLDKQKIDKSIDKANTSDKTFKL